jgi:hypothetical protein
VDRQGQAVDISTDFDYGDKAVINIVILLNVLNRAIEISND